MNWKRREDFTLQTFLKKIVLTFNEVRIVHQLIFEALKFYNDVKVGNILKGSLDSIPSLSPSVKIQIMNSCKGRTLLGIVKKLLKTKRLLAPAINILLHYLKYALLPLF